MSPRPLLIGLHLALTLVVVAPSWAQLPRTRQEMLEWYERNVSPEQRAETRARFAARDALCGAAADNFANPRWTPCVNAVDDMFRRTQPPELNSKPRSAAATTPAAKPGEQRVWVNGVVIPTCSHGGLCHGQLMEALQWPAR